MQRKNLFWIVLIHVLLPLFIGLVIYLLYRPQTVVSIFFMGRSSIVPKQHSNVLYRVIIDSGPDFCWSYSFTSAIFILNSIYFHAKYFFPVVLLIIIISEFIQFFLPRYFTFDWIDIGAAVAGVVLSYFIIKNRLCLENSNG